MNKQALESLETIEKSWREDRIRSDLLPAIQSLRRTLSVWPFPPFPNPLDRPGQAPGPDKYTPGDDDEPAPY